MVTFRVRLAQIDSMKNTHTHTHFKHIHMTTDYSARGVYRVAWLLTPVNEPNAMEIK